MSLDSKLQVIATERNQTILTVRRAYLEYYFIFRIGYGIIYSDRKRQLGYMAYEAVKDERKRT